MIDSEIRSNQAVSVEDVGDERLYRVTIALPISYTVPYESLDKYTPEEMANACVSRYMLDTVEHAALLKIAIKNKLTRKAPKAPKSPPVISWYKPSPGSDEWGFTDRSDKWSYKVYVDGCGQIWISTNFHVSGLRSATYGSVELAKEAAEKHASATPPKPYSCPSCGKSSRTVWTMCVRGDCPDGRDQT